MVLDLGLCPVGHIGYRGTLRKRFWPSARAERVGGLKRCVAGTAEQNVQSDATCTTDITKLLKGVN